MNNSIFKSKYYKYKIKYQTLKSIQSGSATNMFKPEKILKMVAYSKNGQISELITELSKYTFDNINFIINYKHEKPDKSKKMSIKEQAILYWNNQVNNPSMIKSIEELLEYKKLEESVESVELSSSPTTKIKYLSYNILVGNPFYEDGLTRTSPEYRNWKNRVEKLKAVIITADIGVLVESLEDKLLEILPANYQYIFQNKIGDMDGTTIFYNKDKFKLINQFSKQIICPNTQVVLVGVFEDILSNKEFAVIGLHLKSGYGGQEHRRQREINLALFDSKDFLKQYGDIPIILSGDLNSDQIQIDPIYEKFGTYKTISLKVPERFGFKLIPLKENEITYDHWQKSVFDYIFIKGNIKFTNSTTGVTRESSTPAPNETQGSDHFPLFSEIELL